MRVFNSILILGEDRSILKSGEDGSDEGVQFYFNIRGGQIHFKIRRGRF